MMMGGSMASLTHSLSFSALSTRRRYSSNFSTAEPLDRAFYPANRVAKLFVGNEYECFQVHIPSHHCAILFVHFPSALAICSVAFAEKSQGQQWADVGE
jgi:hypothetical protein